MKRGGIQDFDPSSTRGCLSSTRGRNLAHTQAGFLAVHCASFCPCQKAPARFRPGQKATETAGKIALARFVPVPDFYCSIFIYGLISNF